MIHLAAERALLHEELECNVWCTATVHVAVLWAPADYTAANILAAHADMELCRMTAVQRATEASQRGHVVVDELGQTWQPDGADAGQTAWLAWVERKRA